MRAGGKAAAVARLNPAAGKIDHIFVVYLENVSFDRVLADFPGADGDRSQKRVPDRDPLLPWEPTHGVPSWRFRRLKANVFFRGKLGPEDRPLLWQWAKDFVLADRHRTQRGPSTPNHELFWTADSDGLNNNPKKSFLLRLGQSLLGGTPIDKQPPYDTRSVPNQLEERGIRWGAYGEQDFDYFTQLRDPATPGHARNSRPTSQFFVDAANGTLPQVNWVFSDSPAEQDGKPGLEWAGRVIEAIKNSPGDLWKSSAILLTWDDWGGYYDHVQPVPGEAPAGFAQGGRVPFVVISPYAKAGTVFHEPTTHCSVDAFIDRVFDLEPVNARAAQSNDLMNAFDFSQAPLPAPVTRTSDVDVAGLRAMILPEPHRASALHRLLHRPPATGGPALG